MAVRYDGGKKLINGVNSLPGGGMTTSEDKRQEDRRNKDQRIKERRAAERRYVSIDRLFKYLFGIIVILVVIFVYFFIG